MSKGPIIAQGTWYHRKLVLTIGLAIMALIQMVVISTSSFPSGKQLVLDYHIGSSVFYAIAQVFGAIFGGMILKG